MAKHLPAKARSRLAGSDVAIEINPFKPAPKPRPVRSVRPTVREALRAGLQQKDMPAKTQSQQKPDFIEHGMTQGYHEPGLLVRSTLRTSRFRALAQGPPLVLPLGGLGGKAAAA